MARNQNPNKVTMNTPRGTLKYPKLTQVDHGTDAFPDKDGSYNTRIVFDGADSNVQTFIEKLDSLMEKAREEAEEKFAKLPVKNRKELEKKNGSGGIKAELPYSEVYDEDTEEPTGELEMRFKRKAGGTRASDGKKWKASRPAVFDSAKPPKPLPDGVDIWGGTVALVNADFEPYFVNATGAYGLQRRLNAVQVFELVSSGGQRSASSYGFEGDEEGFDASGIEVPKNADDDDREDQTSGSDDDDDDDGNF